MTDPNPTQDIPSPVRWPLELQSRVRSYLGAHGSVRSCLKGEIWLVLHTVLAGYARLHSPRLGGVADEDICDLSAQKALDLLSSIDSGRWNPTRESEARVRAFLSTVARNGIVDLLRTGGRTMSSPNPEELDHSADDRPVPGRAVEVSEFISYLRQCVDRLTPRMRKVWFFRVIYEMSSKQIADHPDIRMTTGHVDVSLQRCRKAVGDCMDARGLKVRVLPPGTFAALWEVCTRGEQSPRKEAGHG